MFNEKVTSNEIKIEGKTREEVKYIYLRQWITFKNDHNGEVKRRIKIGWKIFGIKKLKTYFEQLKAQWKVDY